VTTPGGLCPTCIVIGQKISIEYLVGTMSDFVSLYSIGKTVSTLFYIDLFAK